MKAVCCVLGSTDDLAPAPLSFHQNTSAASYHPLPSLARHYYLATPDESKRIHLHNIYQ